MRFQRPMEILIPIEGGIVYDINVNDSYIGIRNSITEELVIDFWIPPACRMSERKARKIYHADGSLYIKISIPCNNNIIVI